MKYLLLLLIFPAFVYGQITENFSDNEFTSNPVWYGNTGSFEIINPPVSGDGSIDAACGADEFVLRSKPDMGDAVLLTPNNFAYGEWRFSIADGRNWAISSTNDFKIILMSDDSTTTKLIEGSHNFNGYYLQFDGGSDDQFILYKQTGTTKTVVIDTDFPTAVDGTTPVGRTIKVKRSESGDWSVFIESGFYKDPSLQYGPTVNDNTHTSSQWFGIVTNIANPGAARLAYLDGIYIGPEIFDTIPPQVVSVEAVTINQLNIVFSENVETSSVENLSNYLVNNSIGNPVSAVQDVSDNTVVLLEFASNFVSGLNNSIQIENVKDLNNNSMLTQNLDFMYFEIQPFDVLINEIFADPSPVVALPEFEYFELFNNTPAEINLANWKFVVGTSEKTFTSGSIPANSYAIICSETNATEFASFGNTIGVSSLPALVNSGSTISIYNNFGNLIHTVTYSDSWYKESYKAEGGWSLEMIDPENPCTGEENWTASKSVTGGSPGAINSVFASNPDLLLPEIEYLSVLDTQSIQIFFSETIISQSITNASSYLIDNNSVPGLIITSLPPDYKSVILNLGFSIGPVNRIYELKINDTIEDCAGNEAVISETYKFALADSPDSLDIIINELLFDPLADGVDYVEIYNKSEKVFDCINLRLATRNEDGELESVKEISGTGFLIFPEDYLVITTNPEKVKEQYYTSNPKGFVKAESLPTYSNTSGQVVLMDKFGRILDELAYTDQMHYQLLSSFDGVSLERINPERRTEDLTNWHSAAETVGFGTPAYKNSQYFEGENGGSEISVFPEVFSPDNDGYEDVVNITYKLPEPGFIINISIYDAKGRLITKLVENDLAATEGVYTWDGINRFNQKANIGAYIVFVEIFDLKGNVKTHKKPCIVASKLN
ncbi:MAG: lamin tail domain-containing protein [Bacteroidales bacterium]|nr:lamin tail domain-containing protein [Bacteroidales bacterium]